MTQLRVRRATSADTEALAAFNADVSRYQDLATPDQGIAAWTRDLMEHRHPLVDPADFCLVEDARTGAIVSSLGLIAQTWSYDGIEIPVGQVELVGTHPDYRGRGLVRRQFDEVHQWAAARGQTLLAIDGIPTFYRQFGYEMALVLRGEISLEAAAVPSLHGGDEVFRVRPAREADLQFIARTYDAAAARYRVACRRDERLWRYELSGRSELNPWRLALHVIETADRPAGFLVHAPRLPGTTLTLTMCEVSAGIGWRDIAPSVLRYLRATGETYAKQSARGFQRVGLCLGTEHPLYAEIDDLAPRDDGAYGWQLRVADVPRFLRHVGPVLERRLAASALAGHTGAVHISFERGGVRLTLDHGRLIDVAPWRQPAELRGVDKGEPTSAERWAAIFPGLTFLQLLFGYRSLDELQGAFADCITRTDQTRQLLQAMFPKQPSNVWPVL